MSYEVGDHSYVEFPLNFCPGVSASTKVMVANLNYVQVRFEWTEGSGPNKTTLAQRHLTPDPILKPCTGKWGLVFKEWEVIKQVAVSLF